MLRLCSLTVATSLLLEAPAVALTGYLDDGLIAAWGDDSDGQVSNIPGGTGFTQVSVSVIT